MSAIEHNPLVECACEDCRFWAVMQPMLDVYRDTRERRESLHILKCVRLAPTLEVCEALMAGRRVARKRLDPYWVRSYGL